ncbi:hypothetical protein OHS70_04765 [Streptomyces sp. NBC_00390]|uniref:hypothetical protein n=1 Tax=Streptomyces sp. NBC_00390 TaxID=2975736 RepID=UPI002E1D4441
MEGIIAGALAVIGTLLGSVTAHRFQEKATSRAEGRARTYLQHERLFDTCANFIGLAEDYRRAQFDRWSRHDEDPDGEAAAVARAESYRLHVETRSSACRLRLASSRADVQQLADQANTVLELTSAIVRTSDRADMLRRGETAQHACDAFVVEANAVLHPSS